jgi:hypothetical protein
LNLTIKLLTIPTVSHMMATVNNQYERLKPWDIKRTFAVALN